MALPVRSSEFVNIQDDFPGYGKDLFCIPKHYQEAVASVLIPHGVIQERIKKIARNILKDVLQEKELKPDTTNIASTEEAAVLQVLAGGDTTLTDLIAIAEEDVKMNEASNHNERSMQIQYYQDHFKPSNPIDTFNSALNMDFLDGTGTVDFDSYSLDLNSILQSNDSGPPSNASSVIMHTDMVNSPQCPLSPEDPLSLKPNVIGVKSFANVSTLAKRKEKVHFLCILKAQTAYVEILKRINCPSVKGGYKFFLDLLDHVNKLNSGRDRTSVQVALDFIRVEVGNSGIVIQGIDDLSILKNSNIVIVEEIVDTGKTMSKLVAKLREYAPKRILIACLLRKRCRVRCYNPDYIGFEVPNKFLVGYALDFNEYFRDLAHICVLSRTGMEMYGK